MVDAWWRDVQRKLREHRRQEERDWKAFTYEHPRKPKGRLGLWWRITCMLFQHMPDETIAALLCDAMSMFCDGRIRAKFGQSMFGVKHTDYQSVFARDGAYWGSVPDEAPPEPTEDDTDDEEIDPIDLFGTGPSVTEIIRKERDGDD